VRVGEGEEKKKSRKREIYKERKREYKNAGI